jgi:hypothetical protein
MDKLENPVLVHFSPAFERWVQGHFDFRSRSDRSSVATTRRSRFTLCPGFEKPG